MPNANPSEMTIEARAELIGVAVKHGLHIPGANEPQRFQRSVGSVSEMGNAWSSAMKEIADRPPLHLGAYLFAKVGTDPGARIELADSLLKLTGCKVPA